ncbi:hypothetical protein ABFX02_05G086400 [Erythranthe guttata]
MATLNVKFSPPGLAVRHRRILILPKHHLPECFTGTWLKNSKPMPLSYHLKQKYKVTSLDVDYVPHDDKDDFTPDQSLEVNRIKECIDHIKAMLSTIDEGRISVSPYDTAWIGLIRDLEGRDIPQFPSTIEWIAQHQLHDGSWGDEHFFSAYDRLVNTLACVVALRSWNVHGDKSGKGIQYMKENLYKLENESAEHMTCGFEVIFPALLQKARNLGIEDIPYDAPIVREIHNARDKKLEKIPMELLHEVQTSLLFSLEGLENLEWEKLLKLQAKDGSFLTSPSSTAFAFMQTKDENCFRFIKNTVEKCNGGAPHTFPVDVFARLWAVDRLERLGVSRFFESEISDCLSYIHRFWTEKGVFSGRESEFCDIDDTSMGFRLLRLHGYDVDPEVFRNFKKGTKFSCWDRQMIESPSPIYSLYRASQIRFPGEEILDEAKVFAYKFLQDMLASNEEVLRDKWVISKHLPDEIRIGLEMPWYASLPRVVTRYYLQHYGAGNEVWIGKTLYRMQEISNDVYLELARLDFNRCQEQHQLEWHCMQEWYANFGVEQFGIRKKDLLIAYFLAAATIFEPARTKERILWAKSQIVCRMITSFLNNESTSPEQKSMFFTQFNYNIKQLHKAKSVKSIIGHDVVHTLISTLSQLFEGIFNKYTNHQLKDVWRVWSMKAEKGETTDYSADEAGLLVTTSNICAGHIAFNEDILFHNEYINLSKLTNKICHQLRQIQNRMEIGTSKSSINNMELEQDMQALVKLVLEESAIDRSIKQTFLYVAKTFYYSAYNTSEMIDAHVFKILFEPIV